MRYLSATKDQAPRAGRSWVRDGTVGPAERWLRGEGDLLAAASGRPVPVAVQLGVLAHGDLRRLRDLGRLARRGSVRRAWGEEMAALAGDLARAAGTTDELRRLQAQVLVPLELEALAGRPAWSSRDEAVALIRARVRLSAA